MFAVHVVLNEQGRNILFESIQYHIRTVSEFPKSLKQRDIKEEYIQSVEIIKSENWNGWKH